MFKTLSPEAQSALIAAITAIVTTVLGFLLKSLFEKKSLIAKLESEFRYEQQKDLKSILAKNKMGLLSAGESLNHRLWNFIHNYRENWLNNRGNYYYSFVYRYASFFAFIRQIEKELFYIDSTFATKNDMEFIKFLRTFPQLFTDVCLFDGKNYNKNNARDHFFRNNFETIVESLIKEDKVISYSLFIEDVGRLEHEIPELFAFFDNLTTSEERYRWDLIQHLHLTIIAFLNSYGYDFQQTSKEQIDQIVRNPRSSRLLSNYRTLLIKNKLNSNKWIKIIMQHQLISSYIPWTLQVKKISVSVLEGSKSKIKNLLPQLTK